METSSSVRRCLVCRRVTLESSSINSEKHVSNASLLQDFLICFHINNVLDSEVTDLSITCRFCPTCEQFLAEWSSIQTQMTQLTRRAAQLEATFSALLLSAPPIQEQNHDEDVTEIIKNRIENSQDVELALLLQQTVDDIRNELRKKYSVNVLLDKIHLPCPRRNLSQRGFAPVSGLSDNDDEPMDDWRGDDNSDMEYLPGQETSEQLFEMCMKTEVETSSDDSDGASESSVELRETKVNRKSKSQTKFRRKSQTNVKRKSGTLGVLKKRPKVLENRVIIPDGPNKFKYNGHSLQFNDVDQSYNCGACAFKGNTIVHSVLNHIRATHYTQEDKVKFTAVKTSDTEWLYGGVYKIISEGEKLKCVTCGYVGTRINFLVLHIRSQHVDREGSQEVVPVPVTDTPIVTDSTPIQGVYLSVPYTFNPVNNKYTCGICKAEIYLRKNFGHHVRQYHKVGTHEKPNSHVIPDGPNAFKYHGHGLTLNVANQCYYCGSCDYKGTTNMGSVLAHIRHMHYTQEDKQKFTAVKTSEGEWLYGGEHKIIKVGEQFKCVSCGTMNSRFTRMVNHIRSRHVGLEAPTEVPSSAVTDTPPVFDSTPIEGQLQAVPYSFNPTDNAYTCLICQSQVGPRDCFLSHIKELHPDNLPRHQRFAVPDGPNTFNYNGHCVKLNDEDKCYYCGACELKGTTYINSTLKHIREMHYTEEDIVKFTAVAISETEWLYGGTFKIIRVGEKFKCVSCGCVKFRLNELTGHIRSEHVDADGNPLEVPLPDPAPQSVSDSTPIQGQYRSVPYTFNPADSMYTCSICQHDVSSTRKQIANHIRDHHLGPNPTSSGTATGLDAGQKVICEICGKELVNQRGYEEHVKRHQAQPQYCPYCNKKYICPKTFNRHMKIHTLGEAAKKYQCEYCGKRFILRWQYANHVRIHTGETPFVCEVCGKMFRHSTDLSAHRKNEHGIVRATRVMRFNE